MAAWPRHQFGPKQDERALRGAAAAGCRSVRWFRTLDPPVRRDSSPLKFRACFRIDPGSVTMKLGEAYPGASPLVAPNWFECFDAETIGSDIESGVAQAVLLRRNIAAGVDRIAALYSDGRGFAWHQLSQD